MQKIVTKILLLCLVFFLIVPNASLAQAQVGLFVVPLYSTYLNPDFLTLNVLTNNNENLFNAVSVNIKFPSEKIKIESIDYTDSFCKIMVNEEIDNINGVLNISCGNPNPEPATSTKIFQINFQKQEAGWAKISLNSSKLLAHDDLGTNITGNTEDHNFYIYK